MRRVACEVCDESCAEHKVRDVTSKGRRVIGRAYESGRRALDPNKTSVEREGSSVNTKFQVVEKKKKGRGLRGEESRSEWGERLGSPFAPATETLDGNTTWSPTGLKVNRGADIKTAADESDAEAIGVLLKHTHIYLAGDVCLLTSSHSSGSTYDLKRHCTYFR